LTKHHLGRIFNQLTSGRLATYFFRRSQLG
jgi:hypothetical protein